jgi:hypothetical protein
LHRQVLHAKFFWEQALVAAVVQQSSRMRQQWEFLNKLALFSVPGWAAGILRRLGFLQDVQFRAGLDA